MMSLAARLVVIALLLAGCGARPWPEPLRSGALMALGVGTALHLWPDHGTPDTVAVGAAAFAPGQVTWLGHSGFLLRLGGQSVLIDPVLEAESGGALRLVRRVGQSADLDRLDRLDAVLITHDHSDHQHAATLRALAARFPEALLIRPVGARAVEAGFARRRGLSAGEALVLGGLRIEALGARHQGRLAPGRYAGPRSPALSYALLAPEGRVFAVGDTAADPAFAGIGARLGPFDLALVPIGSGDPEAVMAPLHASPEQAVQMALDLRARRALPHHWGAYLFSPRSPGATLALFRAAAAGRIAVVSPPVGGSVPVRAAR